ncbi:YcaO-like family protein [Amycolatopsis australiensis]|uniref:Ribosomal protein S12 methylthiotransferase accessory factor n=1 Tax=Amycolatopsis australiensis TaxID=546364 RepID=A0A1K1SI16_9PSEU|nr:YcaO-like family protein [Amycolatopsis australiensis]SFW83922.1 ribosomal protein S12 methylthiotransferase accessory factor [Amycolatopsis australiensis]
MPDDVRPQLTGVEVHDLEPGLCLLFTPNGGQYSIAAPVAEFRAWLDRIDGTRTRAELLGGMNPDYAEVLDVLEAHGCLRPPRDDDAARRLAATTVLLTGAAELTGPLADILALSGYARVEPLAGAVPDDSVVVAAFAHPAYPELTALDAFCAEHGVRFFPFRCERGEAIAGPAVRPGAGPDFADVLARRRSAALDPRVIDAFASAGAPREPRFRPGDTRWLLTTFAAQLERWIAGEPTDATTGELELDPARLVVRHRPVLPVPDRPRPVVAHGPRPDLLVDDRTGIVTAVHDLPAAPGMPARLKVCAVDVADMRRVTGWPNDRQAFGTSWHDFELASASAVGEAVERYCGSWLPPDREIRHDSFARLSRDGVPALDPRRLNLYSPRQYRSAGFPFTPLTTDSECAWVEGFSHTTGEAVWVPACLVSQAPEPTGARFTDPLIAGLAAGTSEEHAVTSGLEEVLERDATMIWWANTPRLRRLPVPAEIRALVADTTETYDVTLIPLDNEFGVPVVAAAVLDRVRRWLSIGFAARPDAFEAAKKALAEGFTLQHTCQALDDEHEVTAMREDLPHLGNLKPYRADRRYLDSYRADFADVVDLVCQQQLHLDPRAGARVAPWVHDLPVRGWDGLPSLGERRLKAYQDRVEARGFEVISVDVTTRDVAAAGFHAAHTLVPGLVANFPAGLPYWGNGRVRRAAVDLGWRSEPLPEERLNVFPLPHA